MENIAVICTRTFGGGAESATWRWCLRMLDMGKRITWIVTKDCSGREIVHENISYVLIRRDADWERRVCELVRARKFDFCYYVNPDDVRNFRLVSLVRACGCRVGVADHSCYFYPLATARPDVYLQRIETCRDVDLVTALSPANAAWFRSVGVRNVVSMPNYLTFDPTGRSRDAAASASRELLFVGRLCPAKAPERALAALAEIRRRPGFADVTLTVLGRFEDPETEALLRRSVRDAGLDDGVRFEGEVRDVGLYFRRAALLVMTSRIEGAPMVINEAKSHGLPTVMYDLPFVDGTGESQGVVTVPQDDVSAFADAVCRCLSDAAWQARLSAAAQESLSELRDAAVDARWRQVFETMDKGGAVADLPFDPVDDGRMFRMTMGLVGQAAGETAVRLERLQRETQERVSALETAVERLEAERAALKASGSYRLGQLMTLPLRAVRRLGGGRGKGTNRG